MKRKIKLLSLLVAVILGQVLIVGPAAADHGASHYIKSPRTANCLLGGQLGSHGTGWVGTVPCKASYWMVWTWSGHFNYNAEIEIRGVASRSCLDANGLDVYMHSCNGEAWQRWRVYLNYAGYAIIKHVRTGGCLQEPPAGGAVQLGTCGEVTNRYTWWRLVSHPAA